MGVFSEESLRHLIPSLCLLLGEHTNMKLYFNAFIDFLAASLLRHRDGDYNVHLKLNPICLEVLFN